MRRSLFFATFAIACSTLTGIAQAAGVYSVTGVRVDVTAANASEARTQGYTRAQSAAWDRLVKRLTLPDEVARVGAPQASGAALDALIANVEVEEERPLGARYTGRLAVNFDPSAVRKTLRDKGLSVVDTRSAPVLVVPQFSGSTDLATQWRNAWAQGGYGEELVPLAVASTPITGAADWAQASSAAAAAGATTALFANARIAGSSLVVDVVEVGAGGVRRERGQFSTPITIGTAGSAAAFSAATDAVNAQIQNEWKVRLAAGAGQRARLTVSAYYGSQYDWVRLKRGLENAAKTVLSGISIDAVSKEAALVSFSYVGARDQLAAELLRNGIVLADTPQGATLRLQPGGT